MNLIFVTLISILSSDIKTGHMHGETQHCSVTPIISYLISYRPHHALFIAYFIITTPTIQSITRVVMVTVACITWWWWWWWWWLSWYRILYDVLCYLCLCSVYLSKFLPPPKEVMFSLRPVCLSVRRITEKVVNGFWRNFLEGRAWPRDQWVQFWWRSGSPSGIRIQESEVRNPDSLDYRLCWRFVEVCALWTLLVDYVIFISNPKHSVSLINFNCYAYTMKLCG